MLCNTLLVMWPGLASATHFNNIVHIVYPFQVGNFVVRFSHTYLKKVYRGDNFRKETLILKQVMLKGSQNIDHSSLSLSYQTVSLRRTIGRNITSWFPICEEQSIYCNGLHEVNTICNSKTRKLVYQKNLNFFLKTS